MRACACGTSQVELPEPEIEGWLAQRGVGQVVTLSLSVSLCLYCLGLLWLMVVRQGGGSKRGWKRRYFALIAETNTLEFYERTRGRDGSGGKKGDIDLASCHTVRPSQAKDKRPHEIGA